MQKSESGFLPNRRQKVGKFIGLLVLVLAISQCRNEETAKPEQAGGPKLPQKPNILWLVAEDLSAIIPPFGDNTVATPNLTRLANEGIRYTQVYSSSGVCAPSRAAIATGMYQNRIGAQHMRTTNIADFGVEGIVPYEAVPPAYVKMHSQYFREAGYYASNNAKEDYQFRKTVTAWDDSSRSAHWRNRAEGQPFFSVFNFSITHESQVWAQAGNPLLVDDNLEVPVPPYLPDSEIGRKDVRQVYSNIVAMDRQVGEILNQLEDDGLLDSTIIFWYSDHGGPLPRQKRLLYDSGIHLPLIIRFPDQFKAGEIDDQLISFVDFKSTILSLAGIEPPDYVDGRAFLGEFADSGKRDYVHAAADRFDSEYDTIRAVRDKRFKYLRNFNPEKPYYLPLTYREQMPVMQELLRMRDAGELNETQAQWFKTSKEEEELFDVENDPYELNNLAGDISYAEKLTELRNELDSWMSYIDDKGLMPEVDLINSMWPNFVQPTTLSPIASKAENDGAITLRSKTEGASIGYQILNDGEELGAAWQIYQNPLSINKGQRLLVIAHRIGFAPSTTISIR
ncbi:MAG: sulfatase [Gammaproteobacteria bacterium]|nr:sulfatase [Gammaproteobacteria bacterium]MDG2339134.1 sulfatase [Gammaproteobacteria bacterium]